MLAIEPGNPWACRKWRMTEFISAGISSSFSSVKKKVMQNNMNYYKYSQGKRRERTLFKKRRRSEAWSERRKFSFPDRVTLKMHQKGVSRIFTRKDSEGDGRVRRESHRRQSTTRLRTSIQAAFSLCLMVSDVDKNSFGRLSGNDDGLSARERRKGAERVAEMDERRHNCKSSWMAHLRQTSRGDRTETWNRECLMAMRLTALEEPRRRLQKL